MAKNVYSLQLLRNGTPFSSYTAAVEAITSGTEQDGVLKLARYTDSNNENLKYRTATIKTIFGIRHSISGATGGTGWTVFDSYTEVIENLQQQIDAMGGDSGSIAEQIKSAIDALNYNGVTTGDGVVVTNVIQESGVVSADSAEVGGLKLTNYALGSDSGAVAANDTINEAISKLQNQVNKANEDADAAIDALDYTDTAVTGSYVSKVDETDGVISVTRVALPDLAEVHEAGKPIVAVSETKGAVSAATGTINAEFVNVADADNNFTASTVEAVLAEIKSGYTAADAALKNEILGGASASADTLGELETLINNVSNAAKSYSIEAITGDALTNLGANVREAYQLVDEDGTRSGEYIKIYKDQTLSGASFSGQELTLTYILADGSTTAVSVDMHDLIEQTEFASGVTWDATASKVRGVVDPTSESFLTVGADGFKLTGVSGLVNNQIADLDADVTSTGGTHVTVQVVEQDGEITEVNVTESDIASEAALNGLSAKTVTAVEMTGGTAQIAAADDGTKKITINADGSTLSASTNYASAQTASAVAVGDSIDVALGKLEAQVAAAKAAATTKVVEGTDNEHLTIISATDADNSTTYTITLTDVASESALTAEIAARKAVDGQTGQTYAANAGTNYISGAIDLNNADVLLDSAIKGVQNEVDAVESGVGLSSDGSYTAPSSGYASGASSVAEAIEALNEAAMSNTLVAGDGIELTEAADGTTVAVDLKEDAGSGDNDWHNPLKFDENDNSLYFDNIDAGYYN